MTAVELERHERRLVLIGAAAGATAAGTYLAGMLLHLPRAVGVASFLGRGPLTVVAFVGFHPLLWKPARSSAALLGTVFGVISGAMTLTFASVQMTNLHYIRRMMDAAQTPAAEQLWRDILQGVFTVQDGINYTADFFLDWTAFFYAIAMWRHPAFGRIFSLASVALVGPHFVMKAITYPEPPAEAGLFDAGPLVSLWFLLVLVQIGRQLRERRT